MSDERIEVSPGNFVKRNELQNPKPKHFIEDLTPKNLKEGGRKPKNTVGRRSIILQDADLIRQGAYEKASRKTPYGDSPGFKVRGRLYGVGDKGRLFPVSGSRLYTLDKRQISNLAKISTPADRLRYIRDLKRQARYQNATKDFSRTTREKIAATNKKPSDISKLKTANDNQVPPKPPRELKNKPTAKEQFKQRYGKKPTENSNAKALKDRSKISSNQRDQRKDSSLAKDKPSIRSSDRHAKKLTVSQSLKKQGLKEKMATVRNQKRDQTMRKQGTLDNNGLNKKGNEIMHGKGHHAERIKTVVRSMRDKGYPGIRVNQTQVDATGKKVGKNKPDISALHPKTGKRINIEYDNKPKSSLKHEHHINKNDSKSVNTHAMLRSDGKVQKGTRTYKPSSDRQGGKSIESQALKKHGAKEKMAAVRGQSREKYQKRNQSLKQSGDQKVKQPKNTSDNVKARYGKSSESSQNKASSSNRETTKSASSSRSDSKPKSTQEKQPKPSGDSKPSGSAPRDGGNRRR